MKKILLIATGGTIASKYTSSGLSPQLSAEELLKYCMKPGSYTEGTAIRTHISIINKKARSLGLDYVIIGEERGYTVNLSFDRKV